MSIAPLTRKQITDAVAQIGAVATALQRLPYRDAVEPLLAVHELQEVIFGTLPGGYAGECPHCDRAVGRYEIDPTVDGICCFDCIEAGRDLPTFTPAQEPAA